MVTLTDDDRVILRALGDADRRVDDLADELDREPDDLKDRLETLYDNGLVHDKGEGWALTRNGHHLLQSPGDGSADDRINTPEDVEATIESFQLRPDREDAVRAAFAYLRFWAEVTGDEIADDVYDEHPAGHDDPGDWWEDLVAENLAQLPGVERPDDGETWRYDATKTAGDGGVTDDAGAPRPAGNARTERDAAGSPDGREIDLDDPTDPRGGLKHALETLDATEREREAVLAAAALLRERGTASSDEIAVTVHDRYDAGHGAPETLWESCIRPAFELLPSIERRGDQRWRHAGAAATAEEQTSGAGGNDADHETDEAATSDAASDEADVCPVCDQPYAGRSMHLTNGTVVPARDARSCVRATTTDAAVAVTIYYHDREQR
jgi:hypothetical protein